jgi:hypothetical protein
MGPGNKMQPAMTIALNRCNHVAKIRQKITYEFQWVLDVSLIEAEIITKHASIQGDR